MQTTMSNAAGPLYSRRLLVVTVLSVVAILAALAPASAVAQESANCTAEVSSTQDPAVASFNVDCADDTEITNVNVRTSESGRISDTDENTECTEEENAQEFDCNPVDPASFVGAQFEADSGDVCAEPRLQIDFTVELEDGSSEEIENVEASGCSDQSGGGEGGEDDGGEDDGDTPEGGVDSGAGGTAEPARSAGASLPLAGMAVTALVLALAGVAARKPHLKR